MTSPAGVPLLRYELLVRDAAGFIEAARALLTGRGMVLVRGVLSGAAVDAAAAALKVALLAAVDWDAAGLPSPLATGGADGAAAAVDPSWDATTQAAWRTLADPVQGTVGEGGVASAPVLTALRTALLPLFTAAGAAAGWADDLAPKPKAAGRRGTSGGARAALDRLAAAASPPVPLSTGTLLRVGMAAPLLRGGAPLGAAVAAATSSQQPPLPPTASVPSALRRRYLLHAVLYLRGSQDASEDAAPAVFLPDVPPGRWRRHLSASWSRAEAGGSKRRRSDRDGTDGADNSSGTHEGEGQDCSCSCSWVAASVRLAVEPGDVLLYSGELPVHPAASSGDPADAAAVLAVPVTWAPAAWFTAAQHRAAAAAAAGGLATNVVGTAAAKPPQRPPVRGKRAPRRAGFHGWHSLPYRRKGAAEAANLTVPVPGVEALGAAAAAVSATLLQTLAALLSPPLGAATPVVAPPAAAAAAAAASEAH